MEAGSPPGGVPQSRFEHSGPEPESPTVGQSQSRSAPSMAGARADTPAECPRVALGHSLPYTRLSAPGLTIFWKVFLFLTSKFPGNFPEISYGTHRFILRDAHCSAAQPENVSRRRSYRKSDNMGASKMSVDVGPTANLTIWEPQNVSRRYKFLYPTHRAPQA